MSQRPVSKKRILADVDTSDSACAVCIATLTYEFYFQLRGVRYRQHAVLDLYCMYVYSSVNDEPFYE